MCFYGQEPRICVLGQKRLTCLLWAETVDVLFTGRNHLCVFLGKEVKWLQRVEKSVSILCFIFCTAISTRSFCSHRLRIIVTGASNWWLKALDIALQYSILESCVTTISFRHKCKCSDRFATFVSHCSENKYLCCSKTFLTIKGVIQISDTPPPSRKTLGGRRTIPQRE